MLWRLVVNDTDSEIMSLSSRCIQLPARHNLSVCILRKRIVCRIDEVAQKQNAPSLARVTLFFIHLSHSIRSVRRVGQGRTHARGQSRATDFVCNRPTSEPRRGVFHDAGCSKTRAHEALKQGSMWSAMEEDEDSVEPLLTARLAGYAPVGPRSQYTGGSTVGAFDGVDH